MMLNIHAHYIAISRVSTSNLPSVVHIGGEIIQKRETMNL